MKENAEIRLWLIRCVAEQLNQVLETMAGESPLVESRLNADLPSGAELEFWETTISAAPGATLTIGATNEAWSQLGSRVLTAAGLDLDDEETIRSTFQETVDQALSGLAQSSTAQVRREVTASPSKTVTYSAKPGDDWSSIELAFADNQSIELFLLWNAKLVSAFQEQSEPPPPPAAQKAESASVTQAVALPGFKNADLLFDVELPVCVSFGRAHLQLRDVMKLTTGSIVELNRTVSEPVEVIVNNCVIARGEVVVVEGNFGVRINEVISRQARLRTLH